MEQNVGGIDRDARIVMGIGIIGLGIYYQSWLGLLGVPILITGILGYCWLYKFLGISTCPVKK